MVKLEDSTFSPLSNLSDDCVLEILDRMPDNSLFIVAETCKRFLELASIQYRRVHPTKSVCFLITEDAVEMYPLNHGVIKLFGLKLLNVVIRGIGQNCHLPQHGMNFIANHCSPNLKSVRFENMMLTKAKTDTIKHQLRRVESLTFHRTTFVDDFYDDFLRHCTALKHLTISHSIGMVEKDATRWLHMEFTNLQSVCVSSTLTATFQTTDHWELFFHRNPSITSFSCHYVYTTDPSKRPVKTIERNARNLQRLYLSLHGIGHLNSTYYDLSVLCAKPQFEYLELHVGEKSAVYLIHHSKMLATYRAFKAVHFTKMTISPVICDALFAFERIEQLHFGLCDIGKECAELLAKGMTNLKRLCGSLTLDDMAPFIRYATKLSEIHLSTGMPTIYMSDGSWVDDLNSDRAELDKACLLTIYIKSKPGTKIPPFEEDLPMQLIRFEEQPNDEMFEVRNTFTSLPN